MSSRESAAIQIEVPNGLLAARVADVLAVLAVAMVGWVAPRYGSVAWSVGMTGLAATVLTLARGPRLPGGRWCLVPGAGTRQLGSTLVVEGRSPGHGRPAGPAWLTAADLPRDQLRRLAVQLRADRPRAGS
jgi:hypothetical protein